MLQQTVHITLNAVVSFFVETAKRREIKTNCGRKASPDRGTAAACWDVIRGFGLPER